MIWLEDFNRHHPLWDNDSNHRLFTSEALARAEILVDLVTEWDMHMALPKDICTLKYSRRGSHAQITYL